MTIIAKPDIDAGVPVINTDAPNWRSDAIDWLGEDYDIMIHHAATGQLVPVRAAWCRCRRPIWAIIREAMHDAGIAVRYEAAREIPIARVDAAVRYVQRHGNAVEKADLSRAIRDGGRQAIVAVAELVRRRITGGRAQ